MRGQDITQDIMPRLPKHLQGLVAEIGRKVGAPVQFVRVASVGPRAKAQAYIHQGRPVVEIVGGYQYLPEILAEELLHLQRRADGHPGALPTLPTQSGKLHRYGYFCNAFTGLLDEYAFGPQLDQWGMGQAFRSEIERILQGYVQEGQNLLTERTWIQPPGGARELDHPEMCNFAYEYARAKLLAEPSQAQRDFLALYGHPELQKARAAGERIANAVQTDTDSAPGGTRRLLDFCLRDVLQVPEGTYELGVGT